MSCDVFKILDRKPCRHGGEIILCYLPHNKVTPWVTWRYETDENGNSMRFWGHYYYDSEGLDVAREFFKSRRC
jgi:hypothetical protein